MRMFLMWGIEQLPMVVGLLKRLPIKGSTLLLNHYDR